MEHSEFTFPREPDALYPLLREQLVAVTDGIGDKIANFANAAALLNLALRDINWVGFYFARDGRLVLGPFQGKPACVFIPWGRGVCGTAAATGNTQRVEDVHAFPGHIACDSASRSEIVLPLKKDGAVVGVLDIDSPYPGRFTREDQEGLELLLPVLEGLL